MSNQPDPRLTLLQQLGVDNPADTLALLDAVGAKPTPAEPDQPPPQQQRQVDPWQAEEAERQAVGSRLLAQARRQIPGSFAPEDR